MILEMLHSFFLSLVVPCIPVGLCAKSPKQTNEVSLCPTLDLNIQRNEMK